MHTEIGGTYSVGKGTLLQIVNLWLRLAFAASDQRDVDKEVVVITSIPTISHPPTVVRLLSRRLPGY